MSAIVSGNSGAGRGAGAGAGHGAANGASPSSPMLRSSPSARSKVTTSTQVSVCGTLLVLRAAAQTVALTNT